MKTVSRRILFAGTIVVPIFFAMVSASPFRLGVENFSHYSLLSPHQKKVSAALITNHTAVDQKGKRTIDIVSSHAYIDLQYILSPEHGITGTIPAEVSVHDSCDATTKIPVISLYKNGSGRQIPEPVLKECDILFFDIQDCGMRHYTYISTLYHVMSAAAQYNKQVVVLDRPNPLGGLTEGPTVEDSLRSFISIAPIPLRHGLTMGELAHFFNKHMLEKKVNVCVIPMKDYQRNTTHPVKDLSPNITSKQSCYGYSFLGLLGEVRPLDVGLGSKYSFRCIGLPKQANIPQRSWWRLAESLKKYGINTIAYDYTTARKKIDFHGLLIKIPKVSRASSFNALLETLLFFKSEGVELTFSPYFDKAIGTSKVREYVQGAISYQQLKEYINTQLAQFKDKMQSCILYTPEPHITLL